MSKHVYNTGRRFCFQWHSSSSRLPFVFGPKPPIEIITTSMHAVIPTNTPATPNSRSRCAIMKPDIIAPTRLAE
ncbi:conserved hypothetical protein [Ricinus communis]|uniref:Uncharacterized protein n=1 Tax=Ricinus communis TaxID=3988 RepID=B9RRK5_RICCO|nr:conserved hypothetical protein [Ricinus communis]